MYMYHFFWLGLFETAEFSDFFLCIFKFFYKPDIKFKIHTCDIFAAFVFYLDDGCWLFAIAFFSAHNCCM